MKSLSQLKSRLEPFRYPKFRKFFFAQGVSLIGTWMQELTKSLLVLHLVESTGSMGKSSAIGLLMMASAIPNLLLGSSGGVLADKKGWKKTLVVTQVLLAATAFFLGILVHQGHIEFWHLLLFAIVEGLIIAFDLPAFQMVTPQLVPKEFLQQALALNATNFHAARVLGPAIAGLVVGFFGREAVFWLNALTFLFVAFVIANLKADVDHRHAPTKKGQGSMKEAITYVKTHPVFLRIFLQFVLVQVMIFPIIFTTLRVLVQERFQLNDKDFGLVFSMPGLGALIGSLVFLVASPKNPIKVLTFSMTGLVLFLFAVAESFSLPMMIVTIVFFSTFMFLTLSALLVTVQIEVEDRFRGRVSALIGMAFASLSPIMAYPMGLLSDLLGGRLLLWICGGTFGLASFYLAYSSVKKNQKISDLT